MKENPDVHSFDIVMDEMPRVPGSPSEKNSEDLRFEIVRPYPLTI